MDTPEIKRRVEEAVEKFLGVKARASARRTAESLQEPADPSPGPATGSVAGPGVGKVPR